MSFGIDFPAYASVNPFTGTTPGGSIDVFNAALENNGLPQLLGSLYQAPLVGSAQTAAAGGSNPVYRYVRYNPTASQTILAGPQLVYWKDKTFTTVTGLASEALSINLVAGWLLYNTTQTPGATAAQINGNGCWLQVGGYLPGAFVTTGTAVGGQIIGAGTTFGATGYVAPNTAPTNTLAGIVVTVAANNLSDLWVPPLY
jgi:hypothetical protein